MHSLLKRKKIIPSQYHNTQANLRTNNLALNATIQTPPIKLIVKKKNNLQNFLQFINQKEVLSNKNKITLNSNLKRKIKLQKQSFSQLMVTTKISDFDKLKKFSSHFSINNNAVERAMKGRKLTHRSTCKSSFASSRQSQQMLKTSKEMSEYSCSDNKYYINPDLNRTTRLTQANFKQKKWYSEHKQQKKDSNMQYANRQNLKIKIKQNIDFNVIGRKPLWRNFQSFSPTLRNQLEKSQ